MRQKLNFPYHTKGKQEESELIEQKKVMINIANDIKFDRCIICLAMLFHSLMIYWLEKVGNRIIGGAKV